MHALSGSELTLMGRHHRPRKTGGMRDRSVRSEHLRDPGFWEGTLTLGSSITLEGSAPAWLLGPETSALIAQNLTFLIFKRSQQSPHLLGSLSG